MIIGHMIPVSPALQKILDEIEKVSEEYGMRTRDTHGDLILSRDIISMMLAHKAQEDKYIISHGFPPEADISTYETMFGHFKIVPTSADNVIRILPSKTQVVRDTKLLKVQSSEFQPKDTIYKIVLIKEDGSEQEYLIKKTKQDKLVMN